MEKLMLYNTLSKKLEEFKPIEEGKVTMYICGPTVYDSPHIGHARTYLSFDITRRILSDYFGYDVTLAMNITNIDDKIINRANERGITCEELSNKYESEFFNEMDKLGVMRPTFITRVTEYVNECVEFIKKLVERGVAYASNGSVYFDLNAYKGSFKYNLLRPETIQEEESEKSAEKRHKDDFVLWKASKEGEPMYDSPWGVGRPGWHIECSAMSSSIFGKKLDIHAGGIDLAFPHHENEIAQCQGHSGEHWVNYFLHTGHLNINGLKMSKSLKNFLTIGDILKETTANNMRIMFLQHAWNKDMNYDAEQLKHAEAIGKRIFTFVSNAESLVRRGDVRVLDSLDRQILRELDAAKAAVHTHLAANMNTAKALECILDIIIRVNPITRNLHTDVLRAVLAFVNRMLCIFGIARQAAATGGNEEGLAEILNKFRSDVRIAAKAKSAPGVFFELSDKVREAVKEFGYVIDDSASGSIIRKV